MFGNLKLARLGLVLGAIATLGLGTMDPALAKVGAKAPAFELKTPEGKTIPVNPALDKRAKLVVFWASW